MAYTDYRHTAGANQDLPYNTCRIKKKVWLYRDTVHINPYMTEGERHRPIYVIAIKRDFTKVVSRIVE